MVLSFPVADLVACAWGTVCQWFSPVLLQALLQRKYSASSDVWSYGIVMFEIWSFGCKPFEDKTAVEVSHVIAESIVKATSMAYWFVIK